MTADDKYFLRKKESLLQPIELILSIKKEHILDILQHFWNLNQILNIWKKKWTLIAQVFQNLRIANNAVRWMSKNKTHLDGQHAKKAQTLLKSARLHCCHIFYDSLKNCTVKCLS